ncbi:MAG: nitroreductase family protein [Thermodesulfobacteriota bacterium]|nr:nitroreductase family protein [Thermodesulfobacteriota bacterium]
MDDLMAAIKNRRSVRKYDGQTVSTEHINELLEAVRWAQSWANTQCWEVVVVQDAEVKEKLAEAVYKGNPAKKSMTAAPVVFVLCAKYKTSGYYKGEVTTKFGDWFMFDMGIAAQNLCLRAHSLGLGGVVVGLFDHDKTNGVLNVPDGHDVICMIPVGHPAKPSAAPKRKEVDEFTHYESF